MCGFCAKSNTAVNCLVSDNSKKSIPFSHNSTFNTLCRIGFYTVKVYQILYQNLNQFMKTQEYLLERLYFQMIIRKSVTFFIYQEEHIVQNHF